MEYLPSEEEQAHLIEFLADLISKRGQRTFLTAPFLVPTDECFPDPWSADADGVRNLAKRLLGYVDLGQLAVRVELFENPEEVRTISTDGRPSSSSHKGAAAWFAGMPGGVCHFGAEQRQLSQSEGIVGCMCHEIAHAYRHYHDIEHWNQEVEERLTDLTTIYLGFGVLTTNISYQYRASTKNYSHQQMGYLSPQSMSFLLAAQVVVRSVPPKEKRLIAGYLETNQRAFFKAALKLLERDRASLIRKLRIEDKPDQFNLMLPVSRVQKTKAPLVGAIGLALGSTALLFSPLGVSIGIVLASSFIGGLVGRSIKKEVCSDPRCGALLSSKDTTCPKCGGQLKEK